MGENKDHNFYRHLGVYGICADPDRLLVVRKILGPYTGKYDLPGGRLQKSESLEQAVVREIREETGYVVHALRNIGACDFSVLWKLKDGSTELLHHIAILYETTVDPNAAAEAVGAFEGQDSSGAIWLPLAEANPDNASPLVLQAAELVRTRTVPAARSVFDYRR